MVGCVFVHLAEGLRHLDVRAPQTVTCRVGTGESPAALSSLLPAIQESNSSQGFAENRSLDDNENPASTEVKYCSVVLAGLHACGDLSATMLRLVTVILHAGPPKSALLINIFYYM